MQEVTDPESSFRVRHVRKAGIVSRHSLLFDVGIIVRVFFGLRRNVEPRNQVIHFGRVLSRFIQEENQFGDYPGLVANPVPQVLADEFAFFPDVFEQQLLVGRQHEAQVHPGDAQVGADLHAGNRNKGIAEMRLAFPLKNIAQLFLNQPGEFLLSFVIHNFIENGAPTGKVPPKDALIKTTKKPITTVFL